MRGCEGSNPSSPTWSLPHWGRSHRAAGSSPGHRASGNLAGGHHVVARVQALALFPPRGEATMTAWSLAPVIPSSAVPATRQRARSAGRRLPMAESAHLPSLPEDVVYGTGRIDASGRIADPVAGYRSQPGSLRARRGQVAGTCPGTYTANWSNRVPFSTDLYHQNPVEVPRSAPSWVAGYVRTPVSVKPAYSRRAAVLGQCYSSPRDRKSSRTRPRVQPGRSARPKVQAGGPHQQAGGPHQKAAHACETSAECLAPGLGFIRLSNRPTRSRACFPLRRLPTHGEFYDASDRPASTPGRACCRRPDRGD